MKQGLSTRVERAMRKRITQLADESPGCAVIVYSTVALHPLVRYGEVLRELRDVHVAPRWHFPVKSVAGSFIS